MKKLTILLMFLIVSSWTYSQDTTKLSCKDTTIKKEIAFYLTEGLECKEILIQRNKQLLVKDSIIKNYIQVESLHNVKDSLTKKQFESLMLDYDACNTAYSKLGKQTLKTNNMNKLLIGTNAGLLLVLLILLL